MSIVFFTDRDLGLKFPEILKHGGLTVERHADHFAPNSPDADWLAAIAGKGWIAVTHDTRIRYKPNELAAVIENNIGLIVVVGDAPYPELADSFVKTAPKIIEFLKSQTPPFIAKLYRPSPAEVKKNPGATGKIELWYPPS